MSFKMAGTTLLVSQEMTSKHATPGIGMLVSISVECPHPVARSNATKMATETSQAGKISHSPPAEKGLISPWEHLVGLKRPFGDGRQSKTAPHPPQRWRPLRLRAPYRSDGTESGA